MNWLIVGQGAIGLLWYHHLQQYKEKSKQSDISSLSLLPSKNHNCSQKTYLFTDIQKNIFQGEINYADQQQLQSAGTVFLCLKSYQIAPAINQIKAELKADANIILAHNGMGTHEELPQDFCKTHSVYSLITTHGCLRTKPLTITHTGVGKTELGLLPGCKKSSLEQVLSSTLNNALPLTTFEVDIIKKQWLKLAINCVINPITALNDIDNGEVNSHQFSAQILQLISEVVSVAKAEGIELSNSELVENVKKVAQATATNCSSMRCDVLAKRQTEIGYINGYIHRLGITHNIATPENTQMYDKIKHLFIA